MFLFMYQPVDLFHGGREYNKSNMGLTLKLFKFKFHYCKFIYTYYMDILHEKGLIITNKY